MKENALLTGLLESTNEPYAIAKIAGIKLCESYNRQFGKTQGIDYRSVMPTNLYGPGDNYDSEKGHVIPSLIYRFHKAKIQNLPNVIIWGTGKPKREFLFVDDMVDASIHIMNVGKEIYEKYTKPMCSHINVGSGVELTIKELSEMIKKVVGYKGQIKLDTSKLDGSPRKFINSNILNLIGVKPRVNLEEGLIKTYKNFLKVKCKF
jgi:GDP-L-fucose synthase